MPGADYNGWSLPPLQFDSGYYDNILRWARLLTVTVSEVTYSDWSLPSFAQLSNLYGQFTGADRTPFTCIYDGNIWVDDDFYLTNAIIDFRVPMVNLITGQTENAYNYDNETGFSAYAMVMYAGDILRPVETNPVPEPATMLLLGAGLIGLARYGRKKLN
jgi:hypothetical protein